jgi:hypothetical protein
MIRKKEGEAENKMRKRDRERTENEEHEGKQHKDSKKDLLIFGISDDTTSAV